MIVKIMSDEDIPDDDSRKGFSIMDDVAVLTCTRHNDTPVLMITTVEGGTTNLNPTGNVYVYTDDGVEVTDYGVAKYVTSAEMDEIEKQAEYLSQQANTPQDRLTLTPEGRAEIENAFRRGPSGPRGVWTAPLPR